MKIGSLFPFKIFRRKWIRPKQKFFLNKSFSDRYRSRSSRYGLQICNYFYAIDVSCLGLLGLASFAAQQRTKEIGIRFLDEEDKENPFQMADPIAPWNQNMFHLWKPAQKYPKLIAGAEDMEQTLGIYGLGNGFYIVWTLIGTSTLRNSAGMIRVLFLNPFTCVQLSETSLVDHQI